jgi:2-polyprenyl-3-methyl-5-hydroxy-6-metoxy-1,4-benzoquinol methylase
METMTQPKVTPTNIMQIGMGFWASKVMLTAVKMELFTHLAAGPLKGTEIQSKLNLNDRGLYDFLDCLVAFGFLKREGMKATSIYSNADDVDFFLDKKKPGYIGGILEMADHRLYKFWGNLEEGLKTGEPQNEEKNGGTSIFEILYSNKEQLHEFLNGMGGAQIGNFMNFAKMFDFSGYKTLCDIGGAGGYLSTQIALHNEHMNCISWDLPPVQPVAQAHIEQMNLSSRVEAQIGDFFQDDMPNVDVITMGNILHDWGKENKLMLIKKAYNSLPEGGALVVIESIIDDERKENAFGMMMSLNMLIETKEGYDFSHADFKELALEAGFKSTSLLDLPGPSSAVIAIK